MWQIRKKDCIKEKSLLNKGIDKLTARLIAQRDMINESSALEFIECSYNNLSHPHSLSGVKEASIMFCNAIKNKETIAVFGDYDCDGIFSSVMLYELCRSLNHKCEVFLPSRLEHGYGLSKKGLQAFKEFIKEPPDLFITVDCGSNNEEEIKDLKQWGVKKIIIIDHHIVDEDKKSNSADVFINWHTSEGTEELCACGEVFQFIRGIRWLTKKVDPLEYLTYAAIGTVADVSPIKGDNRIIVKHGLNEFSLSHVTASGLHAIINTSYIFTRNLTTEDVSFKIAPRINACGRISDAKIAFNLLIEKNLVTAELMASSLSDFNKERKTMQKDITLNAIKKVKDNPDNYKYGILLCDDSWHIGVVGIVASRLVEEFNVPVIIVGKHEEIFKGSGRSMEGIDLKEILDNCKELFVSYGGHSIAAGVTLKPDVLNEANEIFNNACKTYYSSHDISPYSDRYYDATLKPGVVSTNVAETLLSSMYPYCKQNNPEPIFKLSDVKINGADIKPGPGWTLIKFYAEKNQVKIPYMFKIFSTKFGADINGRQADIYFSFPQNFDINKPSSFEINLVDMDIK